MIVRPYKMLADFDNVNQFLRENYLGYHNTLNILQPFWEYAHVHPMFNTKLTHRIGIWEENNEIIGVACYEMDLGECYLNVKIGYDDLKLDMIEYAEKELSIIKDNHHELSIIVYNYENHLKEVLLTKGYQKMGEVKNTIYRYDQGFKDIKLPEGYKIISLEDEDDFKKINAVLWRGFNHGDEPDDDLDSRKLMQSAPNFKKDLTIIIKAPNDEYACFAGMWIDEVNHYAYLEPLATDPSHRRKGLATIALMEAMKRTQKYNATYCYGGSREFYFCIGFEEVSTLETWHKEW